VSIALLENGQFEEASRTSIEALRLYKDALLILQRAYSEEPTPQEELAERTSVLWEAINRADHYLQQLRNTTRLLQTIGHNTSVIETKLAKGKETLAQAISAVNNRDWDQVAVDLSSVKTLLLQAKHDLERLVDAIKKRRIEAFISETQERFANLKDSVSIASNLSEETKNATLVALNQGETSLDQAESLLQQGILNKSVDELINAKEKEQEATKLLKSAIAEPNEKAKSPANSAQQTVEPTATFEP
jgi:hypothetical protein